MKIELIHPLIVFWINPFQLNLHSVQYPGKRGRRESFLTVKMVLILLLRFVTKEHAIQNCLIYD